MLGVALILVNFGEVAVTLARQPLGIDLLPLWTAAQLAFEDPARLYDFQFVTDRQAWLLHGAYGQRPFAYPPSALLAFAPLALAPFAIVYPVWTALTAAFMGWASLRTLAGRKAIGLLLLIATPACFTAALVGQTTFLIGGMVVLALSELKKRPLLAGALLGLAAAIKPTTLFLAPVALVAGGHWRALAAAVGTGLMAGLAALALFGLDPWFAWLGALGEFRAVADANLLKGAIAPLGALALLDPPGWARLALQAVLALVAVALVWRTFRKTEELVHRLFALLGGGLLAAPYAMHYEAALLAPAAMLLVLGRIETPRWSLALATFLLLAATGFPYWGAPALVACLALAAITLWPRHFSFIKAERPSSTDEPSGQDRP